MDQRSAQSAPEALRIPEALPPGATAPGPEAPLDIARQTGLRTLLHGVSAQNAREILVRYVNKVICALTGPEPPGPLEAALQNGTRQIQPRAPKVAVPTDILEARAQGRAEALAIILRLEPGTGLDRYVSYHPAGFSGDQGVSWKEVELGKLLRAGDSAWSLLQDAESEYRHSLGLREQAQRIAASVDVGPTPQCP